MPFNSLEFLLFAVIFFSFFKVARNRPVFQNLIISIFSYFFYSFGDLQYFPLLFIMGAFNYLLSIVLFKTPKRWVLALGLMINVGLLIWGKMRFTTDGHFPLGLSFYTFQAISFLIDVYRGQTSLALNFWHFQAYLFFFPQLIAGPICRARELLSTLASSLPNPGPAMIRSGFYLVTFGLLKKAVLADAIGVRVDEVFRRFTTINDVFSWALIIVAYGWQIYFDFSGYTDMARGMAKLMGINLPLNFAFPYGARSPREFWQKWHMTLSYWFRDYVYIPLGGSKKGKMNLFMAITVTFVLSALWHGFGWNYVLWGLWHIVWLLLFHSLWKFRPNILSQLMTLFVVFAGWIFFRARDDGQLVHVLNSMTHIDPRAFRALWYRYDDIIILSVFALGVEVGASWFRRNYRTLRPLVSDSIWALVTLLALTLQSPLQQFVYFRF